MDLTKTRMQLMPKGTSPIAVARDVIAQGGIKGLYAGCVLDVYAAAEEKEDEGYVTLAAWRTGRIADPTTTTPVRDGCSSCRSAPLTLSHSLPLPPPLPTS
jgi:hypothetical protein